MKLKRHQVLALIRVRVAETGEPSSATRLYLENRISRAAFDKAVKAGLDIYRHNKNNKPEHHKKIR